MLDVDKQAEWEGPITGVAYVTPQANTNYLNQSRQKEAKIKYGRLTLLEPMRRTRDKHKILRLFTKRLHLNLYLNTERNTRPT